MVNSNFYGVDGILMKTTTIQSARAGNIIYLFLLFRRSVERQELEPVIFFILHFLLEIRINHLFFDISIDFR